MLTQVRKKDFIVYFEGMSFVAGPDEMVAAAQYRGDESVGDDEDKGLAPKYIAIIVVFTLLIVGVICFIAYKVRTENTRKKSILPPK